MTTTDDPAVAAAFEAAVEAARPQVHRLHLVAILDDGRWFEANADQRDMRRAMIAIGTTDPHTDPLGFPRACAWAWLTRMGQLSMGWAEFDAVCAEVTPPDDDDETASGVEVVDPTGGDPAA